MLPLCTTDTCINIGQPLLNLGVDLRSSILVCRVIIVFPLYRLLGFIAGYDILNQPDPV